MKRILLVFLIFVQTVVIYSQSLKPHLAKIPKATETRRVEDIKIKPLQLSVPSSKPHQAFNSNIHRYGNLKWTHKPIAQPTLKVVRDKAGLPIQIEGKVNGVSAEKGWEAQSFAYLQAIQEIIELQQPQNEFIITKIETDALNQTHIRLQQVYKNVKVYGGEVMLHAWDAQIQLLNGRYYPTPSLANVQPTISQNTAIESALQNVSKTTRIQTFDQELQQITNIKQATAELVIYHPNRKPDAEHLAWAITLHPNLNHRWQYFVDAKTGAILHKFSQMCTIEGCQMPDARPRLEPLSTSVSNLTPNFFPPRTATTPDLFNINRTINTWQQGNTYFLIDASRPMFNAQESIFPGDPVGVIWTLDIKNQLIEERFSVDQITSASNTWNNRTSVSAHYNAGRACEYYLSTFQRNSIDGRGGNILSFINVVDEDSAALDNAFWNGVGIFYGNGNTAFNAPLAKALDVAGHEMSHGVIESTANLEYENESGALNESFADVFGAMIDRDDWKIGEDISRTTIFPSGAIRDLSNPHNGRTSLGQNGFQPDRVAEQYRGSQDNGGVHINSGIPNRAYYLFATAIGKEKAEQVFYRALTQYLTRSSEFIDLRLAVLRAAGDLYGTTEVTAATNAFNTVGITGTISTSQPTDLSENAGRDYILYSDENQTELSIVTPAGDVVADAINEEGVLSKPSITDDGRTVVYVDDNQRLKAVSLNWTQGTITEETLSEERIWRNAAISKDGTRLAALTNEYDNKIIIFDLTDGQGVEYELYNPTYTEGIRTGDVAYADILEWDYEGESVMYDALTTIRNPTDTIEQWDIGFIRVWNNGTDDFGDGMISKLFTGLPENVSIGNPTFSKNSPYIIAFDYIDAGEETYFILGANVETGDVGEIYENSDVGYPNYSVDDRQLIFDARTTTDDAVVAVVNLAADKISAATNPPSATILIDGDLSGAHWGTWFAIGTRQLVDDEAIKLFDQSLEIFPNPFEEIVYLRGNSAQQSEGTIEVFDQLGKRVNHLIFNMTANSWQESISLRNLPAGNYVIRVRTEVGSVSRKIVKLK